MLLFSHLVASFKKKGLTSTLAEPHEPFGLRMVVVSLICATWSLKSELSIAAAISSVSEVIPETL